MRILVTLANIVEYGLDTITGNTREELMAKARKMHNDGYAMYVNIPDVMGGDNDIPAERNVFDHFGEELPTPEGFSHKQESYNLANEGYAHIPCSYRRVVIEATKEVKWICNLHDVPSKYKIEPGSNAPCLSVDPYGHDWKI